jgi:hypothetical protein
MTKSELYKTLAERATEGVEIIRKLKALGVSMDDPYLIKTRTIINKWIKEGELINESIEFPRYGRRLELVLPKKRIHAASAAFKVIDEETRKQIELEAEGRR